MFAKEITERLNRSEYVFQALRIRNINRDVLRIQLFRKCFQLRCSRDQHDLGLEGNDPLDAGRQRIADLGRSFRLGRVVTISGAADQTISGAHGEHNLGEVRRQGNDAIDFLG